MLKLVGTMNSAMGDKALPSETLNVVFDKFWGDFKDKFDSALKSYAGGASSRIPQRTTEDMIQEVLELARSIQVHLRAGRSKVESSILEGYVQSLGLTQSDYYGDSAEKAERRRQL